MGGIFLYFGASKAPVTKEAVAAIVNKYLDGLPGKRRFYFHREPSTAANRLRNCCMSGTRSVQPRVFAAAFGAPLCMAASAPCTTSRLGKQRAHASSRGPLLTCPSPSRALCAEGDLNMRNVYAEVNAATGKKYVTMPDVLPAGEEAAWMAALTKGGNQGCGHMRLMIDQFADYGLPSADVPKFVIEAFYK